MSCRFRNPGGLLSGEETFRQPGVGVVEENVHATLYLTSAVATGVVA